MSVITDKLDAFDRTGTFDPVAPAAPTRMKPSKGILASIGAGLFPAALTIGEGMAAPAAVDLVQKGYQKTNAEADDIRSLVKKLNDPQRIRAAREQGIPDKVIMAYRNEKLAPLRERAAASQQKAQGIDDTFNDVFTTKQGADGYKQALTRTGKTGITVGLLGNTIPAAVPVGSASFIAAHPLLAGAAAHAIPSAIAGAGGGTLEGIERGEGVGGIAKRAVTDAAVQGGVSAGMYGLSQGLKNIAGRFYAAGVGAPKKVMRADIQQAGPDEEIGPRVKELMNEGIWGTKKTLGRAAEAGLKESSGQLDDVLAAASKHQVPIDDVLSSLDDMEASATRTDNQPVLKAVDWARNAIRKNGGEVTPEIANVLKRDYQGIAAARYGATSDVGELSKAGVAEKVAAALRRGVIKSAPKAEPLLAKQAAMKFLQSGVENRSASMANKLLSLPVLLGSLPGALIGGVGGGVSGYKDGGASGAVKSGILGTIGGAAAATALTSAPVGTGLGVLGNNVANSLTGGAGRALWMTGLQRLLDSMGGKK